MSQIRENLTAIERNIKHISQSCGRNPDDIALVAVSKRQTDDVIDEALNAGLRRFGENRVQEAQERWTVRKQAYPDLGLHLIGPLQTNKVRDAVALFDVIETVDREKLVDALVDEMKEQGRDLPCFIQVNTGEEPQKSGVAPSDLPDLLSYCRERGLNITGLMCIPPQDDLPALHFGLLKKLAARHELKYLSMGMSADYERAIALGATHIRIGTALLGGRTL